jgi:hypothetical protein
LNQNNIQCPADKHRKRDYKGHGIMSVPAGNLSGHIISVNSNLPKNNGFFMSTNLDRTLHNLNIISGKISNSGRGETGRK